MGNQASTLVAVPSPVQEPHNAHCAYWYPAKAGDTCEAVARAMCGDVARLQALNPALAGDCGAHLWAGTWYCLQDVGQPAPCAGAPELPAPEACPPGFICKKPGEDGCPADRFCKIEVVAQPDVTSTAVVVVTAAPVSLEKKRVVYRA
ncbi:hypothetical protein JX265_000615 [Neoarthrinium moseri]|uniref:LysM domain-containing protein n=1 Tax=Neoarthrinium moseri TaxID=1658444 RepID=A0A9P9WZ31_9PEZI|nr:hypothetical protein JX266_001352 [Neoarthrinium moseri]KAI1881789.1 hypothetical protein JX265_000615 [Neoarthrinium moseri]